MRPWLLQPYFRKGCNVIFVPVSLRLLDKQQTEKSNTSWHSKNTKEGSALRRCIHKGSAITFVKGVHFSIECNVDNIQSKEDLTNGFSKSNTQNGFRHPCALAKTTSNYTSFQKWVSHVQRTITKWPKTIFFNFID